MGSNDLQLLKHQIRKDNKVVCLLEELECEYVHEEQRGNLIAAQLPKKFGSNNRRSVQVKNNNSLTSNIRSRGIEGDIYSIIGYILYGCETFDGENGLVKYLYQIKNWICNTLDYDDFLKHHEHKEDYNSWLKKLKKKRIGDAEDIKLNTVISEPIFGNYLILPHTKFIEDGLTIRTQYQFGVAFDLASDRIVFPIHNRDGELIGVKGRYVGDDEYTMKHQKYMYLYPCDKSVELFNLHRALPHIKEKGEVIVVEGAKSCMLLWQWGFKNCVSIEGNALTPVQARLLKSLDVNIVFAWDKDIDMEFVKKQTRQIRNRLVFVIFDKEELLTEKNSPVDKGKTVWYNLYMNNRVRV